METRPCNHDWIDVTHAGLPAGVQEFVCRICGRHEMIRNLTREEVFGLESHMIMGAWRAAIADRLSAEKFGDPEEPDTQPRPN